MNTAFYTDFRKKLISLMIPLSLQGLLQNVATTVDSLMLGVVSKSAMSASAIAIVFMNFQIMSIVAIGTACGAMISKSWVNKDFQQITRINKLAMSVGMGISVLFFLVCLFIPDKAMSFYTADQTIIQKGAEYLKILGVAYLFKVSSYIRGRFLCVVGLERKVTIYNVISNLINIALNGVLIYGIGVVPGFEIKGAAMATLISAIIEFTLIFFTLKPNYVKNNNCQNAHELNQEFFKRFGFCAMQFQAYTIGINIIAAAFGHMNSGIVAVFAVISTISGWLCASRDGFQDSAIILMSEILSQREREEVICCSRVCEKIGAVAGIFFVAIFLALTIIFAGKYMDNNEVAPGMFVVFVGISAINLYFGMLTTMIQGSNLIPGGDIIYNFIVDLAFTVCVATPLFLLRTYITDISVVLYIVLLKSDEIIKYPFLRHRSNEKKWLDRSLHSSAMTHS